MAKPMRAAARPACALVVHMTDDAMVQWAWDPGGHTPPLSQAEFHRVVRRWAATGAACPA
jgi:hypothetical protein